MNRTDMNRRPWRLWPGLVIAVLQAIAWLGMPIFLPELAPYGLLAAVAGGVLMLVWWLFFSRAPWFERLGVTAIMVAAVVVTRYFLHESIATSMMGMMFPMYVIPTFSLILAGWAYVTQRLTRSQRYAAITAATVLPCIAWTLIRTDGFTGDLDHELAWRWSETHEQRLVASRSVEPMAAFARTADAPEHAVWPGFRGPQRNAKVQGVRVSTDWAASPPAELWRREIGPGWSSFAVQGDLFYTQEQRGEEELVSCHRLSSGEPVWRHRDTARFWEANGGAGPRATPTLANGQVYTLGATGIVNVLDALTGERIWTRNAAKDTDMRNPGWGFSGSPLIVGDIVVVAASGRLAAYDRESGELRWTGPKYGAGYSSPHLLRTDDADQVLLLNTKGIVSVAPDDGELLWQHDWPAGNRIVQPAILGSGELLISEGESSGIGRLAVTRDAEGWSVKKLWTSNRLKPNQSDFVVHKGHAYGFDGSILACIDLEEGRRQWKGGRYGHGQLILLSDQDVLLILSERGEIALVSATPDKYRELARVPGIESKTWNHPVLAGDVLLVRNGREMAAFRLAADAAR